MIEAHYSKYTVHPGSTKMYHDLKQIYWWDGMKCDVAEFVAQCSNCQQVKVVSSFQTLCFQQIGTYI